MRRNALSLGLFCDVECVSVINASGKARLGEGARLRSAFGEVRFDGCLFREMTGFPALSSRQSALRVSASRSVWAAHHLPIQVNAAGACALNSIVSYGDASVRQTTWFASSVCCAPPLYWNVPLLAFAALKITNDGP